MFPSHTSHACHARYARKPSGTRPLNCTLSCIRGCRWEKIDCSPDSPRTEFTIGRASLLDALYSNSLSTLFSGAKWSWLHTKQVESKLISRTSLVLPISSADHQGPSKNEAQLNKLFPHLLVRRTSVDATIWVGSDGLPVPSRVCGSFWATMATSLRPVSERESQNGSNTPDEFPRSLLPTRVGKSPRLRLSTSRPQEWDERRRWEGRGGG